jgi:hypothetical protein
MTHRRLAKTYVSLPMPNVFMDCRVKPGNDEKKLKQKTLKRLA